MIRASALTGLKPCCTSRTNGRYSCDISAPARAAPWPAKGFGAQLSSLALNSAPSAIRWRETRLGTRATYTCGKPIKRESRRRATIAGSTPLKPRNHAMKLARLRRRRNRLRRDLRSRGKL